MLLAIAIVAALGPGLVNVLISIAIGYVPEFARITRASVMTKNEKEFIEEIKNIKKKEKKGKKAPIKGENIETEVEVSIVEAFNRTKKKLKLLNG